MFLSWCAMQDWSPIRVHAAGHFHYRQSWVTERSDPTDHLLILVGEGMMDVTVAGQSFTATTGELVMLPPHVPHRYRSISPEWQWYWLHGDGPAVGQWWQELRTERGPARIGVDSAVRSRFTELVSRSAAAGLELTTDRATLDTTSLLAIDSCAHSLLGLLLERRRHTVGGVAGLPGWILDHLGESITVSDLADVVGVSVPHLHRLVRDQLATTPMRLVNRLRLERAQRLLTETDLLVTEIAALVGYDDPLHFSRRFRQMTGHPPSAARGRDCRP